VVDALADLVERRGPALLGYARALCGNSSQAEDLVADALVKVYGGRKCLPRAGPEGGVVILPLDGSTSPGSAEGYVRAAILSLFLDDRRRSARWLRIKPLIAEHDIAHNPSSGVVVRVDVAAALAALPPRRRACAVLKFYDDLTTAQIADSMGIAQGTVARYVNEATTALRAALGHIGPWKAGHHDRLRSRRPGCSGGND
jgi:RNA polymerase sigma-70 factor (ECF subfamily)